MSSRAGTSTRKLARTPHGFAIYVLGGPNGTTQSQTVMPHDGYDARDRYDAHARQTVPVNQPRPRKLTKSSPDARLDAVPRTVQPYAPRPDERHYTEAPRMPRRSSSRSTDTRSHTTPSPPYDYPPSASRNPTPNTHAGVSAYPFPADDQGTYTAQPTQATPYTTANGVTYVQRAQGPSYHHAPVPTYPNGTSQSYSSAPSSTYSHPVPMGRTRSRDPSPTYSYGVPQVATPYDEITRPREPSPARGRPSMRRGDPYDSMAPTPTPSVPPQPPMRRNSSERRMSESAPSAPRLPNAQPSGASALARVDSHQLYRRSMQQDNAGSWNGEKSSRSSVALERLEEGNAKSYAYAPGDAPTYSTLADAQYVAQGYRSGEFNERLGFPGSPGSDVSSSGSEFSMPTTPPPLHVDTGARTVRWNQDLHLPSPVHRERRKGWFNARGDQLWTNSGAYKPPNPGEEYPEDLRDYPDVGHGYMNEHGVRIDMQHCRIPVLPTRSALKRRDS